MKPVNKIGFWKERLDNAVSLHYSVYVANEVLWANILKHHRRILGELIKPTDKVLDAGCGYGRMSAYIDDYTGVDFSPDFIQKAKELFPNKTFIQADLATLPFKDKEFDVAICVSIKVMIVNNLGASAWESMEKELRRVAKKIILLEYEDPTTYEVLR